MSQCFIGRIGKALWRGCHAPRRPRRSALRFGLASRGLDAERGGQDDTCGDEDGATKDAWSWVHLSPNENPTMPPSLFALVTLSHIEPGTKGSGAVIGTPESPCDRL